MELSGKEIARAQWKSSQRGKSVKSQHHTDRGHRVVAQHRDLGDNFERYAEEGEEGFTVPGEAPVRKSKGADFAKLLAETDDSDLSYTCRGLLDDDYELFQPPDSDAHAPDALGIDLEVLGQYLEQLPLHRVLEIDPLLVAHHDPLANLPKERASEDWCATPSAAAVAAGSQSVQGTLSTSTFSKMEENGSGGSSSSKTLNHSDPADTATTILGAQRVEICQPSQEMTLPLPSNSSSWSLPANQQPGNVNASIRSTRGAAESPVGEDILDSILAKASKPGQMQRHHRVVSGNASQPGKPRQGLAHAPAQLRPSDYAGASTENSSSTGSMDLPLPSVVSHHADELAHITAIPATPGMMDRSQPGGIMEARALPLPPKSIVKATPSGQPENQRRGPEGVPDKNTRTKQLPSKSAEEDLLDWLDS
eukprot:jgi/Botrbrau1/14191/Bobra.182_3s0124.1